MIEFGVLGTLRVRRDGTVVAIPTVKARQLLALLLARPGEPISVGRIAEALWGAEPPSSARRSISVYISRLRDVVDKRIESQSGGYLIRPLDGELDSAVFDRALAEASDPLAGASPAQVADALRAALAVWRGPAFEDFRGVAAFDESADRLDSRRIDAFERWVDLELDLTASPDPGRHVELVPDLVDMITAHPFRERLRCQLMLALYRSGRVAEALEVYRQAFRIFTDELGVEPGAPLADLHRRILAADPTLMLAASVATAAAVPQSLPNAASGFAGREEPLALLDAALDGSGTAAPIAIVSGTAGVGKTTLAVYWAHRAAHRFRDGQLYADLRGFDPVRAPAAPEDVLRTFLTLLGEPADRLGADVDVLSGLFRTRLAGRRMLIVLDNARTAEQIRPLLAADPRCATLVTSRSPLLELIAVEGATHLPLPVFTEVEAVEMLARRLGDVRLRDESDAVAEIITLCARLPLALAIVAARAAVRPSVHLARTAAGLRDRRRALDELQLAESSGVRVAFSLSYDALSAPAATLFRRLGVHPGPDFGVPVAASLAGVDVAAARELLGELTNAHLVDEHQRGRYRLHDLLRTYAGELADAAEDGPEARSTLFRHYSYAAYCARRIIQPELRHLDPPPDGSGLADEWLGDRVEARGWFRAEIDVLLAVVRAAMAAHGDREAWHIAWCAFDSLMRDGRHTDNIELCRDALASAERLDDPYALAVAGRLLGMALMHVGRFGEAEQHLRAAAEHARSIDDARAESVTRQILGHVYSFLGRHQDALDQATVALALNERVSTPFRLATIHNDIGWHNASLGNHAASIDHCRRALALFAEAGTHSAEAAGWDSLGYAAGLAGDRDTAVDAYQRAAKMRLDLDELHPAAESLERLGDLLGASDDRPQAVAAWQEALAILTELGHADADRVQAKLA